MTETETNNTSTNPDGEEDLNTSRNQSAIGAVGLTRRSTFMRKLGTEGENATAEWEFDPPGEGEDVVQHTVAIKRLVLDPDANPEDVCVLELKTKIDTGDQAQFPIAYLRQSNPQIELEIILADASILRLAKGKGPVYVIGEYAEEWRDDENAAVEDSLSDENEGEDNSTEEEDEGVKDTGKENGHTNGVRGKRKAATKASNEDLSLKKSKKEGEEEAVAAAAEPMDQEGETNKA